MYGLPKVHKEGVPMRPIVSTIGSPTYRLAKELARILTPLTGKNTYTVKNSGEFVRRLKDVVINPADKLVSFDVTSLFTQVPLDHALKVVEQRLMEDHTLQERTTIPVPHLVQLTELCVRSTYFSFQNRFYKQKDGAAMGSPLSPIIANLFMEDLEEKAIHSAQSPPTLWIRYVDDTFVIWQHGEDQLLQFHRHLNQQCPSIQFTMEREKEGGIAFLDVMVIREGDHLHTSVYRKPTHTDRYIPFHSHHHPRVLTGVMRCMRNRALQICDNTSKEAEMQHLETVFQANGFPEGLVKKTLSSPQATLGTSQVEDSHPEEEPPKILCTPYVRGVSERLEKVCAPLGVKAVFKPQRTMRQMLVQVKEKIPTERKKEVVYEVACKDCDQKYIGETKRTMKKRLTEHKYAVRKGDEKNGIAVHANKFNHSIDWESAGVLSTAQGYWNRRTLEAIHIRRTARPMNLDCGLHLSPVWNLLIDQT